MPVVDPAIIVLASIAISLLLFVTERVRYDLIAIGVATTLAGTGVLTPKEAFGGFSSPAVMLVAGMYIFGAAFTRWGIAERLGAKVLGGSDSRSEFNLVIRIVVLAALLSSVLSNAGVVAILIPVLCGVGRREDIPVSKLLMPLAYGSLLGGLLSVIATSKNLAINGIIADSGHLPLELFEFSHYGLILMVIGSLYFVFPGRQLLPDKRGDSSLTEHYQVKRFVTEVLIEPNSTLINRSVADAAVFSNYAVTVIGIVRPDSTSVLAPGPYNRIRRDDVLILQGEPEDILRLRSEQSLPLVPTAKTMDTELVSGDVQLVEAVVPSRSPLDGHTLEEADFYERTGVNVLAISKHGKVQPGRITDEVLEVGDTLLIQGHDRDLDRIRRTRELLLLDQLETPPIGRGAMISIVTLVAVLVIGFFGWMPLSVAVIGGALLLLVSNCVPAKELYSVMDIQALVLIGGMLALGQGFRISGLDQQFAAELSRLGGAESSPYFLVAALLLGASVLTQLTTHIAAATIMTPVALSIAEEMGVNDRAFIMAVITGTSFAFLSPVAHPANAMIVGPGDYKYRDFIRVGAPLLFVLLSAAVFLIPALFPLHPEP